MSDVVDLFKKKKDPETEEVKDTEVEVKEEKVETSFEETMRKNEENRLRMIQERNKANKGVIRSYRLKT
jgi:di/tripeptidase